MSLIVCTSMSKGAGYFSMCFVGEGHPIREVCTTSLLLIYDKDLEYI